MTILSLSSKALQEMINICYEYSCLWRYQYNSGKCAVVTFNESKRVYKRNYRSWVVGNNAICEREEYNHLGIICNKYTNSTLIVKQVDRKLRGAFFGLIKDGLYINGLNPLTSYSIYRSIVIPRALFGCELLQSLSDRDMLTMERSHRLCLKQIQGLQIRSRTDIVLGLICALPIEAEIEKRKLSFLGQLCRLERDCATKRFFLLRLLSFVNSNSDTGFVSDIAYILNKFNIYNVLEDYINYGVFPSKTIWKHCIDTKVSNYYIGKWNERTSTAQFVLYRQLQKRFAISPVWDYAKRNPNMLRVCFSIAQLIAYTAHTECSQCTRCGCSDVRTSLTEHILINCTSVRSCTISFQNRTLLKFGGSVSNLLVPLEGNDFVAALFGLNPIVDNELHGNYDNFYKHVALFLHSIWTCYKYLVQV